VADDAGAGGIGEESELLERALGRPAAIAALDLGGDEEGALPGLSGLVQSRGYRQITSGLVTPSV
jgi:hypothetical protein